MNPLALDSWKEFVSLAHFVQRAVDQLAPADGQLRRKMVAVRQGRIGIYIREFIRQFPEAGPGTDEFLHEQMEQAEPDRVVLLRGLTVDGAALEVILPQQLEALTVNAHCKHREGLQRGIPAKPAGHCLAGRCTGKIHVIVPARVNRAGTEGSRISRRGEGTRRGIRAALCGRGRIGARTGCFAGGRGASRFFPLFGKQSVGFVDPLRPAARILFMLWVCVGVILPDAAAIFSFQRAVGILRGGAEQTVGRCSSHARILVPGTLSGQGTRPILFVKATSQKPWCKLACKPWLLATAHHLVRSRYIRFLTEPTVETVKAE